MILCSHISLYSFSILYIKFKIIFFTLLPFICIYSPALFPPTKDIALISGCSQICLTVSNPPYTTLKTPLGKPISYVYLAIKPTAPGTLSLGLSTIVFPNVIDKGIIHNGIIAGKLKGHIPAVTPIGSL